MVILLLANQDLMPKQCLQHHCLKVKHLKLKTLYQVIFEIGTAMSIFIHFLITSLTSFLIKFMSHLCFLSFQVSTTFYDTF